MESQYDDGFKVWINGRSVVNANVALGDVPFDATANSALENAAFVPFPGYFTDSLPEGGAKYHRGAGFQLEPDGEQRLLF